MFNLAAAPAATTTGGSIWSTVLTFGFMFVIFYFLLIRPQQKRSKQRNAMLANLQKNDQVITIGGIHGTIMEITDEKVVLKVNENTKLTFERSAINGVAPQK